VTKARKNSKSKGSGQTEAKAASTGQNDASQAVAAMDAGSGHIDQIRDIIFGRQMADYEARFQQLEDRFNARIETLHRETENHLKALNDLIKKQSDTLSERLSEEKASRGQEGNALHKEIATAEKTVTKAIAALSARHEQDVQALGEQLTALSNELTDELHIQQVEASKNLEQAVQELDDAKLARVALSQMLVEMADQLSDPQK
jgi:hypothetical protein